MENRGLESPIPVPERQSAFHPHTRRNAFRHRDADQQSKSFALRNQRRLPSGSTQVRGQDAASAASASGKIWNTSSRRELFKTSRTVSCNPASKNFPP